MSRHLEVWDEHLSAEGVPTGFRARFGGKTAQALPHGCELQDDASHLEPTSFLQVSSTAKLMRNANKHGGIADEIRPALVPYPKSVSVLDATKSAFALSKNVEIKLAAGVSEDEPYVSVALANLRRRISEATAGLSDGGPHSLISLEMDAQQGVDPDGYKIVVEDGQISLKGYGAEGLSHGITTIKQLIPLSVPERKVTGAVSSLAETTTESITETGTLPAMVIEDSPAFKWRGLHLDVSRHFFPASDVKKLLDTMAAYKLNRFHWHLTDDQGWRFPVKDYPELTRKGAGPRFTDEKMKSSGEGIEGSYTEDDIKDVLAHAKALHIKVIPEVDVPGHVAAAVAAYPELGNAGFKPPAGPQHEYGVHKWTLAPTKTSEKFLESVFGEIARLFPDSEYIHFGGDEAPEDQWRHSSRDAKKSWEHFEGRNPQSYFNKKVSDIIRKHGRKMAGWDEVQSMGSLPQDAAIFAWRGENELRKAVNAGRTAINALNSKYYLDHYQGPEKSEPKAIGGPVATARDVYEYDPLPSWVPQDKKHLVLGAQGQLWSEYFPNWGQVEYMAWPRAIALAERLWTPSKEMSYPEFEHRLKTRVHDLEHWGVAHHKL